MEKSVESIRVRTTDDGMVLIEQEAAESACGIVVSPDQIPQLVEWLHEAATAISVRKVAADSADPRESADETERKPLGSDEDEHG